MKKVISLPLVLLLFGFTARAQTYSMDWFAIAGGGGTSSGGAFSVAGTIGQPDAGTAMAGGVYSLTGGFWSLDSVVQTPGMPLLTIAQSGGNLIISWPAAGSSYTLQQNRALAGGNWATSGYSVTNHLGTNYITIPISAGNWFFRLQQ